MDDKYKTKKQLINELSDSRKRIDELEENVKNTAAINEDVAGQSETEKTFTVLNKYLQSIIDCSLDMIVVVDKDRRIVDFNKAACETFGYSKEEIIGKHVHILYFNNEEGLYISSQIVKNGMFIGEIQNIRKNGEVFTSFLSSAVMRDENGEIVGIVGNSRDITGQKQSEAEIRASQEQLRALTEYLHQVREKERTFIAREIHDELGQALTALKMDVSWIERNLPEKSELLPEKIKSMSEIIDGTLKTTKEMVYELRPTILDDFGLEAALEWHAKEFQNRTEITCEIHTELKGLTLEQNRSTTIFRIFQESLTNVARHSNATRVKANVKEDNGNLVLRVEDNGKGITEEQINDSKSFGLFGMRERLILLKGKLKISSVKDKGTKVVATVPLERRREHR